MKRIAVLTSGGDAPGMNAAIRSVVRVGLYKGLEVVGVRQGYQGLIEGSFIPLGTRDVGGIIQRGGTILGSARCLEFTTLEGQVKALRCLRQAEIEGLVVIGGNGSQTGAAMLEQLGFPVIGVASTIDNDLVGTEITIGVDTALNIALEAVDRLKITASSHRRAFLLEVMGRKCGYLALMTAIAGGAEAVVIPEQECDPEDIAQVIEDAYDHGKAHAIVIVAEGAAFNARNLEVYFQEHRERLGFDLRVAILGHIQRGGNPGAFDRILATRLAAAAVECLIHGESGILVGWANDQTCTTPYSEVIGKTKTLDMNLLQLAKILD